LAGIGMVDEVLSRVLGGKDVCVIHPIGELCGNISA